tara:strand:+ start:17349 stop:18704 length:1356 start_codon:yes stop_codon:yes gene_type:complete
MIFNNSYSTNLLAEGVKSMKAQNSADRRSLVTMFLDYYDGDNTNQYIQDKFDINNFREVPCMSFNITKRLIDKMSRTYQLPPNRTLASGNDQYKNLSRFKNYKMGHVERMTNLLGTVALQITMSENMGEPVFKYEPILYFDVTTSEMNPLEITSIQYPIFNNVDDASQGNEKLTFAYFDNEKYMVLDNEDNVIVEEPNPYGRIPFVFINRQHLLDSVFSAGAYDIVSCNEMLNILFTELNLGLRFQLFGQYVASGVYEDEKFERWGSDQVITVPDGVDVKLLQPMPNVDSALKVARSMVELVATNNHMSVSFAETSRDRPQSGIALKIKELESHENFEKEREKWSFYEQEIFMLERVIASVSGINIGNNLGVDFKEPEYPQTAADEIAMQQFLLDNDLTTKAKILRKYNKDLTLEQAEQEVKENKESNEQGKEQQAPGLFGRIGQRPPTAQ